VRLLIVGEQAGRLAQVDFTLHDAVRRLLVEAARHEAAAVHHLTFARGDGEEREAGVGLPEIEKRVEVIGHVAGREQRYRRMRRVGIAQRDERGLEPGGQLGGLAADAAAALTDLKDD